MTESAPPIFQIEKPSQGVDAQPGQGLWWPRWSIFEWADL
jgi:hypothetical protein